MRQHRLVMGNRFTKIEPPLSGIVARKAEETFSIEQEDGEFWHGFDRQSSTIFTGLVPFFVKFAKKYNVETMLVDRRQKPEGKPFKSNWTMRDYQEPAVQKMVEVGRGMLSAGTGSGKCLHPSSMVFTGNGLLSLEEIAEDHALRPGDSAWVGETVASLGGRKRVATSVYSDGVRSIKKVTLVDGIEIMGTTTHKLLCADESGEERFVPIGELSPGDYVCLSRGDELWGDDTWANRQMIDFEEHYEYGQSRRIKTPPMNNDVAYFMGALVADGSTSKNASGRPVSLCIHKNDKDYLSQLKNIAEEQFGVSAYIHSYENTCSYVAVSSQALCDLFKSLGVSMKNAHEKVVPRCIRTGSREIVLSFLRGLVDGDGCVESNQISYSSSSKALADTVQLLLLNFGIVVNRRMKETYCNDHYVLSMSGEAALQFVETIGFTKSDKREKAERLSAEIKKRKRNTNKDVVPHAGAVVAEIVEHVRESGHYANRFFGDSFETIRSYFRTDNSRRMPSYNSIEKLIRTCEEKGIGHIDAVERLRDILDASYYYSKVESIEESGDSLVLDLTVPDTHCYVANGIVSHNTSIALTTFCRIGAKGLVIVPTQIIWGQFIKTAIKMFLKDGEKLPKNFDDYSTKKAWQWAKGKTRCDIGIIGQSDWEPGFLTIAISAALDGSKRSREFLKSVEFFYADECFHPKTRVLLPGGERQTIKELVDAKYDGPVVCWDEANERYTEANVIGWVKKKPTHPMVRVSFGRVGAVSCTDNHEFLTLDGWREAKDLRQGDMIIAAPDFVDPKPLLSEEATQVAIASSFGDGCIMRPHNRSLGARLCWTHGLKQEDYMHYKMRFFETIGTGTEEAVSGYTGGPLVRGRTGTCAELEAIEAMTEVEKAERLDALGLAILYLDDGSRSNCVKYTCKNGDVHHYTDYHVMRISTYSLSNEAIQVIIDKLADLGVEARRHDGKKGPTIYIPNSSTRRFSEIIREHVPPSMEYKLHPDHRGYFVDRSGDCKPSSEARYLVVRNVQPRKSCEYVYCLEVEGHHNFIANSVVAHNCHHLAADTWFDAMMRTNAYYRFGGSGTVLRTDGQDMKLFAPTGPILYTITTSELIRAGWLAKPIIKMIRCPAPGIGTPTKWADYYRANVAYGSDRTSATVALLRQSVKRNIKTLCIVGWDEHAANLLSRIQYDERRYIDYVKSGHGKKAIQEAIERFATGEVRVLMATTLLSEGYDLCSIDRLIRASGMESFIKVTQETGRVLRINNAPQIGVQTEVYDFYDMDGGGPLTKHSQSRLEAWQSEEEFSVSVVDTWMQMSLEDQLSAAYSDYEPQFEREGMPEASDRVTDLLWN